MAKDDVIEAIKWNPDSRLAEIYKLVFGTVPDPYQTPEFRPVLTGEKTYTEEIIEYTSKAVE